MDEDHRLPVRLRGQIESTNYLLRYAKEMTNAVDPGLRLGFTEHQLDLEVKLEHLRAEARRVLRAHKPEAALALGAK